MSCGAGEPGGKFSESLQTQEMLLSVLCVCQMSVLGDVGKVSFTVSAERAPWCVASPASAPPPVGRMLAPHPVGPEVCVASPFRCAVSAAAFLFAPPWVFMPIPAAPCLWGQGWVWVAGAPWAGERPANLDMCCSGHKEALWSY